MAINVKCPNCGGTKVQLSNEQNKHGCLNLILFGWWFVALLFCKFCIGLAILICYDWWMAIIQKQAGKGHSWVCKRWFSNKKRLYYCHDCGHNFKG